MNDSSVYADSHAVLIGVSHYEDTAAFQPIRAAANSLKAMYALLTDPALCGWPPERITMILDPFSRADVESRLADLAESTTGVLLMYYVGHGLLSPRGELCLTVASTTADRPKITGLPWESVTEILHTSNCPARVRVAILDCCFAGQAITESLSAETDTTMADAAYVEGVYTLTATIRNRTAHVVPPIEQEWARTSFTGELCDLVRLGIPGRGARLTFAELYPVLRSRLRAKGLPLPNQRGTDTAEQFPFTANRAWSTDSTAERPVSVPSSDVRTMGASTMPPSHPTETAGVRTANLIRGVIATLGTRLSWTIGGVVTLALAITLVVTIAADTSSSAPITNGGALTTPAGSNTSTTRTPGTPTATGIAALIAPHTIAVATCQNTSIPAVTLAGYDLRTGVQVTADQAVTLAAPNQVSLCSSAGFDNDAYTETSRARQALEAQRTTLPTPAVDCFMTCLMNAEGTLAVTQDYDTGNSVNVAAVSSGVVSQSSTSYQLASGCEAAAWLDNASVLCVALNSTPDLTRLNAGSGATSTLPVSSALRADGVSNVEDVAFSADLTRLLIVGQASGTQYLYITTPDAARVLTRTVLPADSQLAEALADSVVASWKP